MKSIAIFPDNTRLAAYSQDKNIFITAIKSARHDSWKQSCRDMNVSDRWIKDGEKLLFWVPSSHRHWFRDNVDVWVRDGLRKWERVSPKVDFDLINALSD